MAVIPWQPEEDAELIRLRDIGWDFDMIGAHQKRAPASCEYRHGIITRAMTRDSEGVTMLSRQGNAAHITNDAAYTAACLALGGFSTGGPVPPRTVRAADVAPTYSSAPKRGRKLA